MADRRYYLLQNLATGEVTLKRNMSTKAAQFLNLSLKRWGPYQWIPARTYERSLKEKQW